MPTLKPDCACAFRRKATTVAPLLMSSPFSAVRFVKKLSRKMGTSRVFRSKGLRNFSVVETAWRRGRDSNPRYPFGYAGFQDRSHQPLGHLSDNTVLLQFHRLRSLQHNSAREHAQPVKSQGAGWPFCASSAFISSEHCQKNRLTKLSRP